MPTGIGFGARRPGFARPTSRGPALVAVGAVADSGAPSWGATPQAGHVLVAWALSNGAITATLPAGWTSLYNASSETDLFYKLDSSGDDTAPTFSTAGAWIYTMLAEFTGVSTFGGTGYATGTATSDSTDTSAPGLIVGISGWNGTNQATSVTSSATDGAGNTLSTVQYNNLTTGQVYCFFWAFTKATGSSADTASASENVYPNTDTVNMAVFL